MKYPVMVEIYAYWVFAGKKKVKEVPTSILESVKARISELEAEEKTKEKVEEEK